MTTHTLDNVSFLAGFLAGRQMRRRDEAGEREILSAHGITRVAAIMRQDGSNTSECAGIMFGYENPDWTCPAIEEIDAEDAAAT